MLIAVENENNFNWSIPKSKDYLNKIIFFVNSKIRINRLRMTISSIHVRADDFIRKIRHIKLKIFSKHAKILLWVDLAISCVGA